MNDKLAKLLGFLLSDGSVYYDKSKRTYCIQFTNKSLNLRNIFKVLMKDCFGVNRFYEIPCTNAVSVRIFSRKIAKTLFEYSPTYRTLPCKSFPKCNGFSCFLECNPSVNNGIEYPPCEIHNSIFSKRSHIRSFISGFTSGDGSVCINWKHSIYKVELTCYHPFLRKQIMDSLSHIEIQARFNERAVFVSGIKPFSKFVDEIDIVK